MLDQKPRASGKRSHSAKRAAGAQPDAAQTPAQPLFAPEAVAQCARGA